MEEKVVLSHVLRSYNVKSLDKPEDITLLAELILRPRDGIKLRLTPKSVWIQNEFKLRAVEM